MYGLAEAYQRRGNLRQACLALLKAARVEPEDAEPWLRLHKVLLALGKTGTARRALELACAREPASRQVLASVAAAPQAAPPPR